MSKNYKREIILSKLIKKGLKPKPDFRNIEYLLLPNNIRLGIKIWGMIDFLKISIQTPIAKPNAKRKKTKKNKFNRCRTIGKCAICHKEVDNYNGFFRLTLDNRLIKLHKGKCKSKSDILVNRDITLEDVE